ncbi:hypothetical protein COD05_06180 [Bacillus cereus]|uniref:restriction endonuclease subunit S n=1 Tax=Bacillus sp. AW TaxID=2293329 RepID=UPI000BF57370|nr:hypothetical protein COJ53_07110 [Bacillus cereus]PGP32393.1 hypothetical protein CN989_28165 [Bacillus cereus]PGT11586.1 hypothetical protein COD05_06180 [Bacillus cereus]RFB76212.1 restriction endonuclease subunit S [Bacillus sp. AW]
MQKINKIVSENPSVVWVDESFIDIDRLDSSFYKTNVMDLVTRIEGGFRVEYAENLFKVITDGDHGKRAYVEKGVPFYTAVNVQEEGFNNNTNLYITEEYEESLKRSRLTPNSLLIVKTGVGTGISCVVGENIIKGNISADVGIFKEPSDNIDPHFISAFMNSKSGRDYILRSSYGSTRNRLTIAELKRLKLPIISKKIQNYIGNKIRKAEQLLKEATKVKGRATNILREKLFQKEVEELINSTDQKYSWAESSVVENRLDADYYKKELIEVEVLLGKKGLKYIQLDKVIKHLYTGSTPKSEFLSCEKQEISFLRVDDIKNELRIEDIELFVKNDYREKAKFIKPESVLVSIAGTIGRSAVLNLDECTTNQNVAVIEVQENLIDPYYLSEYFNSFVGKLSLERVSTQATVKYINNDLLRSVKVPLLEKEDQNELRALLVQSIEKEKMSKRLIEEAKQDVENLIGGTFVALNTVEV